MRQTLKRILAVLAPTVAGALAAVQLSAQPARAYAWYAQLASVDEGAKTITVKAQIKPAANADAATYKPGDKLMLVWTPVKGESDTVIYAPKFEVMKTIDEGYILPVEFVAADPATNTMTVKTAVTDAVLQSVRAASPGQWIKVTTPMHQGKEVAMLTSAEPSARPDLKPPPPEPMPPPDDRGGRGQRGRGRVQAPPDTATAPSPGIAGAWNISGTLRGNAFGGACTFQVEETRLTGICNGSEVTGEVNGKQVKFKYSTSAGGDPFDIVFEGTLDATELAIKGTVLDTASNFKAEFSGKKGQ
jgi:hypothetical protein